MAQEPLAARRRRRSRDWLRVTWGWRRCEPEDRELKAIKASVREMEEAGDQLKELQNKVEKQMNMSPPPGNAGRVIMSIEGKMEADAVPSMLAMWTLLQQQKS
ncbi:Polyadenylate-binding protein 2 [Myotis brandtii]|uniref:Polyadenylate-binding protein 2 n=1 Tax=Myotis brandtii TaxID=109478 RepID=S7P745_MYOBR|nr:Polyadenylate-binding protein 2 [Myotis brandtii]